MGEELKLRRHADLTFLELGALRELFDAEYFSEYGQWNPNAPYGYSPADFHVLAYQGSVLTAHLGFQRRIITVGDQQVMVAGVGGVLVHDRSRGSGIGGRMMRFAQTVMREEAGVEFGFLGCREEVVSFYESAGWIRIHVTERCLSRTDQTTVVVSEDEPNLICSATRDATQWPPGDVDLRGTPW